MRKSFLSAASLLLAVSSVSVVRGQTITTTFTEDFEDGNAASRWDFYAREPAVDPTTGTPDAAVNFAFDYSATTFTSYAGGAHQVAIGAAPSASGFKGAQLHVNDGNGSVTQNITAAANLLPKTFSTTGDFNFTFDVFANNSDPSASGSSEFLLAGLNAGPTNTGTLDNIVVGPDQNTAATSPNRSANGYAFASSNEGGFAGDYRVYAPRLANDDGPRTPKKNATWTGTSAQPVFNSDGTYTGTQTNVEEQFNDYYKDLGGTPNNNGAFVGGIGKNWIKVGVQQRGNIVAYTLNGKIINTLFLPGTSPLTGRAALGAYDGANSTPADTSESYFLFDNVKIDNYADVTANTISATDNYARFNGGATTINGASTINFLQLDTADSTVSGTGAITLGTPTGGIWSGGGNQTVSKPVIINADTAIYVDGAGTTLTSLAMTDVSYGTGIDLHKAGTGKLTLSTVRSKTLTISTGTLAVPSGANKVELLNWGYNSSTTEPARTARLDIGKSVWAVDYSNAALMSPPPATVAPLSPYTTIAAKIVSGYAADGSGNPQWNGAGIITSAPELQGASYLTSIYKIRVAEAATLGYGDGAAWGGTGLTIDATTVLFGITFAADSNLDQAVDFSDLLKLAQGYDPSFVPNFSQTDPNAADFPRQWYQGDSNGDGIVNFDDLLALAQNYGGAVGLSSDPVSAAQFATDWALAQSLVPEPMSLTLLGLGGLALRRRRA